MCVAVVQLGIGLSVVSPEKQSEPTRLHYRIEKKYLARDGVGNQDSCEASDRVHCFILFVRLFCWIYGHTVVHQFGRMVGCCEWQWKYVYNSNHSQMTPGDEIKAMQRICMNEPRLN